MFDLIPLGVSSATPTRERHLSALALHREGELFLFDCGEGTQYQLMSANLKPSRLKTICITHLHGDHLFGLPGLLSTLSFQRRIEPLLICGPYGLRQYVEFTLEVSSTYFEFPLEFQVLLADNIHKFVLKTSRYTLEARPLDHRVTTFGYRFQETDRRGRFDVDAAAKLGITRPEMFSALQEGRSVLNDAGHMIKPSDVLGPARRGASFAYCTDTRPSSNAELLGHEVSVLYHDATFASDQSERAHDTGHSTARQAAEIAQKAGASALLLGHMSARYQDPDVLVSEAHEVFPRTYAAEELVRYAVRSEQPDLIITR